MVWLKHVKRPVMQPAVVEDGDRVVATNGPMNDQEPLSGHAPKEAYEPRGAHVMTRGTVNRRMVLGMATAGVAAGSVVAEGFSSPALAATTTEPGAVAPDVVALTDAPTIAVNAALGNDFRVTIAANRSMGNPANAVDGQKIVFQITQGGAGSCTITWGSLYEFSTALPQPTLSSIVGQTDLLAFIYNAALGKWLFVAFVGQFYPAPTVSSVSPNTGPKTGGTPITITGTGFVPGAQVVIGQGQGPFGGIAATVKSITPTTITATTGGGAKAGSWNLFVLTPGGASLPSSGDSFAYYS